MPLLRSLSRGRRVRAVLVAAAIAATALSAVAANSAAARDNEHGHHRTRHGQPPVQLSVLTPSPGDRTSTAFMVDLSLQARNARGNSLLSQYKTQFVDPTGPDGKPNPAFHPGASAAAPGLVVTLSTTPNKGPGTPLQGPRTNLAGVFQLNSVTTAQGLTRTWNDWQVGVPGFFGTNTTATLTAYVVAGTAPDVVPAGGLTPISNVVHETFSIGS
jgi:hypothetical protein